MANPAENIHRRLEFDKRTSLEYGVPFKTIPYKKIRSLTDDLSDSETIDLQAADLVEREAQNGRFGAFVTRTWDGEHDIVEIWSWAD